MIGFNEQKELFQLIGNLCEKKIECLVVGGSAMLFYDFKSSTKDVDLIFYNEEDRKHVERILLSLKLVKVVEESSKEGKGRDEIGLRPISNNVLPSRFEGRGYILDLFAESIFRLKISPSIKDRITEKIEFKNFIVNLISPEDIVLLKSVTDRKGDRLDAASIIKRINVKWDVIIKECLWQSENSYRPFGVNLFDFLEDLDDNFKVQIPKEVRKKVTEIMGKQLDELEKLRKSDVKSLVYKD